MFTTKRRLLSSAAIALVSLASPAVAQVASGASAAGDATAPVSQAVPTSPNNTAETGEIIVTAQKRTERLNDVPMSIAAASSQQLQSRGVVNTDDLMKIVPGFSFQKSNYGLPVYYIRGVGFSDTTLGVSPAVTVYVDQVPLPFSPMARGAILDLERVEVLKGPQGTLFGQNSTGGAVNYIAAKPTKDLAAGMSLTVGRFDQVDAEAYVSGPITSTLSARLAIRHEYQGDWQRGYTNGDTIGSKDFTNGRLLLDWNPSTTAHFEFQANAWQDRSDTQQPQWISFTVNTPVAAGGRPISFPLDTFPAAPHNNRDAAWDPGKDFRRNDRFYQFSLRGDIDLSDAVKLTSITSYAHLDEELPQDFDATTYPADHTLILGTVKSFSQELRLSGDIGERVKWMAGGNYQHDKVDEFFTFDPVTNSASNIGPFTWNSYNIINNQNIKTAGGFGSVDYKLTDNLTIQGSGRYTKQWRDFEGCIRDDGNGQIATAFSFLSTLLSGRPQTILPGQCSTLSGATGAPVPIVRGKLDQHNFSWRGSVNWKPSRDTLLYVNVTKGYKAGSFPTLPAALDNQYTPVTQESVLAYEAGTKIDLFNRKLTIDAAGFYYDYLNKQLLGYRLVQPFGALPSLVSIPKSRVTGAELNVTVLPVRGFRLSLSGTYLDTKVRRDPINPIGAFGTPGSFVGQSFPYTPRWQGTADAEYRFDLSGQTRAFVGGSVTARSQTKGALFNGTGAAAILERQLIINGYALVDLRAGLEASDQSWRIELWGRNVTNQFYSVNSTHTADYTYRFTGMPATFGVTLKYNFHQ
jgi:outer membrane receptor protein involved in Fe transport